MDALKQKLRLPEEAMQKWSVEQIHSRDLLATLHLLVAMAKHFKPELELPASVSVEVLLLEVTVFLLNHAGLDSQSSLHQNSTVKTHPIEVPKQKEALQIFNVGACEYPEVVSYLTEK
ncbi:UNVERIFIED_CONTAM: hypothetical protein FKN15_031279 [Acipenser sinensis]